MRFARVLLGLFLIFLVSVATAGDGQAAPPDLAARGLDGFIYAPSVVAPGGKLEIALEAFGFPTITRAVPLPSASIEAGWDPETLDGPAPPTTVIDTDAEGRGRIVVDVPTGAPKSITLLVGIRHGGHRRTRTIALTRSAPASVELHTADTRVVPQSTISAWIRVADTAGDAIAGATVTLSLLEGGVARHTQKLRTERGGLAFGRIPIPRIDEIAWEWTLRAQVDPPSGATADVTLRPREEKPGTPTLRAAWEPSSPVTAPGARVPFAIRVQDATGQPLADHPVRYWIGPKGTLPPTNEAWPKASRLAMTDGAGTATGFHDAPTLVKSTGTSMTLLAKTEVEGRSLEQRSEVPVGIGTASAELHLESGTVVPGTSQRMLVRVTDGHGDPVVGPFRVVGDGLDAAITTSEHGEAEVRWNAPEGVGAARSVGPCAGGVAAAVQVKPTTTIAALKGERDAFALCVPVDRSAGGILRVEPTTARPGDTVQVTLEPRRKSARAFAVLLHASDHPQATASWIQARPDGSLSGDVRIPDNASAGTWTVNAASPDGRVEANAVGTSLLIVPKVLPLLTVKRVGGRATPGGSVEVEAQITDGHGHGLPGVVSAIVVDAFGGGTAAVGSLDARTRLCSALGAWDDRCTGILEGSPGTAALRRALLGERHPTAIVPTNDPGMNATKKVENAFALVLKSLEGAVFEAAKNPQTLIDVRRKEHGRWVFNPEMFTLVTDAMEPAPETPGGEPLVLSDLTAVDPQVTFDNVARRVTRLKLFRVLAAVREHKRSAGIEPDEPVLNDPNALVHRIVRDGALEAEVLVDPWGGTIQFTRSTAPPIPFLSVARGWELHSPGPDGLIGTPDDVKDPFERVVRSGTPYALAVDEDRLVDAKWDMHVSQETVTAWQQLLEALTGTALGGGIGLHGTGEGGGGQGFGIGLGSIGTVGHGSGRGTAGISFGDAYWAPPLRTDAEGRLRMTIPLGDVETTWRIGFVSVPDAALPASATLDIASDIPVSARVDSGARWIDGDVAEVNVVVRNRTNAAVHANVSAVPEGTASLDGTKGASVDRSVDVPAKGARTVRMKLRGARGTAGVAVTTRAAGHPDDVVHHRWEVLASGESRALTSTAWVTGKKSLGVALDHGYVLDGKPRLVLERGYDDAVASALDALEPERQTSTAALADAFDAAKRIERWATTRTSPRHRAIAEIAKSSADRAHGRYLAYARLDASARGTRPPSNAVVAHARLVTTGSGENAPCPDASDDDALAVEPPPGPQIMPCWGGYVASRASTLATENDPERLARAILAFAERPHRAALAASLAARLRTVVRLLPSGDLGANAKELASRDARALVYAALLRTTKLGDSAASADVLFGRLAVLRDVTGGYGSSAATLAVVQALLASQLEGHGASRVHIHVNQMAGAQEVDRDVDVPDAGFITLPLPDGTLDVDVVVEGPALVARFERPVLRSWSRPPPVQVSPVSLDVVWPADARVGTTGTLRLVLRHASTTHDEVDVKIPLPPGVTLAAESKGATQLQGALFVRQGVDKGEAVVELPVRFGLAGRFTVPEAIARLPRDTTAPAVAPARPLFVSGGPM